MRRRLVLGLALVATAVGTAELGLRFGLGLGDPPLARLDPATEYELVPSARYRRWGNAIEVNSHGMRGREPGPPDSGERRVLLIGDSVVYGTNLLDQDETIGAQLERRLSAAGCETLALPLAASSWGPENQRAALERTGVLGAGAAVILLSSHDLHDVPLPSSDILPYRLTRPWGAIGDAVEIVLERRRQAGRYRAMAPLEARALQSLAALDAMADQLAAAGIRPVLAYHPTLSERRDGAAAARARFLDWAQARGLRFLDLGAAAGDGSEGYRDDIHPNALGAAQIAAALAEVLALDLPPCAG